MSRTSSLAVLLASLVLSMTGCAGSPPKQVAVSAVSAVEDPASAALRAWDERRAAAYAAGAVGDLRRLYVRGSAAGAADVRLLEEYVERGLVIVGMRMQVLALDVLRSAPGLLRLRVTDRLVGAEARGPTGVLPLPRDEASTRVVTLRLVAGSWRVDSVRAQTG
ncbi:MAG TPA: hypothetical protein VFK52_10380 [Nocardioidaceae bacterium]|nr:hypothetical protein [Nocardioidaceae bacterium]